MIKYKFTLSFVPVILIMFALSCKGPAEEAEKEVTARVPVTITGIQTGSLTDYTELTATSVFQNKSVILSPAAGYVQEVKVVPGEGVSKNTLLLLVKTKEASALHADTNNPFSFSGVLTIRSAIDGNITSINHAKGDYVMEGEPLVSIAVPGSFVFIMEVPFELTANLSVSSACEIILPDGNHLTGKITSKLPLVSGGSQTQKYIIQPQKGADFPENLMVKVRITKKVTTDAAMLPKSCVLADEVMKNFWVMKLINDSVAVKVPVITGLSQGDNLEIREPVFLKNDRFLSSGNYGLPDTARIIIENRK